MKYWSCLAFVLLTSCVDTSKVKIHNYDDLAVRLLACDFIIRNVGDGIYVVKWICD